MDHSAPVFHNLLDHYIKLKFPFFNRFIILHLTFILLLIKIKIYFYYI